MKHRSYFPGVSHLGWPKPSEIEHHFLAPPGLRWFSASGNDGASFEGLGAHDTEHHPQGEGRIDVRLFLYGNPNLGVMLTYMKSGGPYRDLYSSKGDSTKMGLWTRSLHDSLLPVWLFIPFEAAWAAVKEFLETDGELPKSIAWVPNRDLPPNSFPDPFEKVPELKFNDGMYDQRAERCPRGKRLNNKGAWRPNH